SKFTHARLLGVRARTDQRQSARKLTSRLLEEEIDLRRVSAIRIGVVGASDGVVEDNRVTLSHDARPPTSPGNVAEKQGWHGALFLTFPSQPIGQHRKPEWQVHSLGKRRCRRDRY